MTDVHVTWLNEEDDDEEDDEDEPDNFVIYVMGDYDTIPVNSILCQVQRVSPLFFLLF